MNTYFVLEKLSDTCYTIWTYPSKQKHLGDIAFDISCGWVYCADDEDSSGYYSSGFLRAIADKLDEMNDELFRGFPDAKV